MTSISEINLKAVNASAKKQTSLYDTPLRELFEEARKKAEEQYKVNKSQIQSATKDDKNAERSVPSAQSDDLISANTKIKEILKEKIKEANKENLAQNIASLDTSDTQVSVNGAYNAIQKANLSQNDELTRLLTMMI